MQELTLRQRCLKVSALLFLLIFSVCMQHAYATPSASLGRCQGHMINPLTDICWQCFFPLTIGNTTVVKGQLPDTPNAHTPICHCGSNPLSGWGFSAGYFAPAAIIEVTRHPYCLVSLGGYQLHGFEKRGEGGTSLTADGNRAVFFEVHVLEFPVMNWVGDMLGGSCNPMEGFGVVYLSELSPTWQDEKLNAVLYPGLKPVLSNIVGAQAANMADCVASSTHLPLDKVYWNAGCQGSLYPVEGEVQYVSSNIQAATLLAERGVFQLHRLGLMQDSSPSSLCHETYHYFVPKSRYRYQLFYPKKKSCYPFGHTTAFWSENLLTVHSSEDYAFIIWKKVNCCAFS